MSDETKTNAKKGQKKTRAVSLAASRDAKRTRTPTAPAKKPRVSPASRKTRARTATAPPPRQQEAGRLLAPTFHEVDRALKIKVLHEGNPRRPGSVTHDHWKRFVKDGITVEEFLAKGGTWLHLRADIVRGHVKLVR